MDFRESVGVLRVRLSHNHIIIVYNFEMKRREREGAFIINYKCAKRFTILYTVLIKLLYSPYSVMFVFIL